ITTGAGNDFERATDLARKMVCEWGMSEMGPISLGQKEEQIFLGREIEQNREALIAMAELLLEREVLDGAEVLQIVQGKTLPAMPAKPKSNSKPDDGQTQQVLRPEGGGRRLPGLSEGERPQPA